MQTGRRWKLRASVGILIRITKSFVQCKFPEDTKLAGKSINEIVELPIHLQLKCLRLRAVHTIVEAAQKAGISRWTLMNYESGKIKNMKKSIIDRLIDIYTKT